MTFELLFLIAGLLFIVMALVSSVVGRLPISASMLYLAVGISIGPIGLELLDFEMLRNAVILERVTEIAVLISLFTAGLKLRVEWHDQRWQLPFRLATISMIVTVFLVALAGVIGLGMSLGAAILLGAILAPTDPVLASDVQVGDP
jgi:NhaP-type Na+/H+ or K+/H+ antiporter